MKKKWMYGFMALGLLMGTYACSGEEESEESNDESTEVTEASQKELDEAMDLETEAIVLDAELDEFIESL